MKNYSDFLNESLFLGRKFAAILDDIDDGISRHLSYCTKTDIRPAFNLLKVSDENSNMIEFTSGLDKITFKADDYPPYYVITDDRKRRLVNWFNERNPDLNLEYEQISDNRDEIESLIRDKNYKIIDTISTPSLGNIGVRYYRHLILAKPLPELDLPKYVFLAKPNLINGNSDRPSLGRTGRVIRRVLTETGYNFTDKQVEDFVNKFRSKVEAMSKIDIEIVKGEDIRKYYLDINNNPSKRGTIGSSCMKYERCQGYLDIYTKNKNVEMVILKSGEFEGKIDARAILWTTNQGIKLMDRIYYTWDFQVDLLKDYALNNGWACKTHQDSSPNTEYLIPNGDKPKKENKKFDVSLEESDFDFYPYTDTLKYLNTNIDLISNYNNSYNGYLESTIGAITEDDPCPNCGSYDGGRCWNCEDY